MADREKVIKEYESFVDKYECFCSSDDYVFEMHKAVLALLKEQQEQIDRLLEESASNAEIAEGMKELLKEQDEAIKPVITPWITDDDGNVITVREECGNCGCLFITEEPNYCENCGRKVKWDD